ncbi:hypothetical protein PTSG_03896, partial [Salpingoeca rosetta]
MMGGAHMMEWEEQLWTHTSMVMVGTSYHSDAVICSSSAVTAITIIIIDRTAAITRRPTPAPIWREADIAHVSRSHEEVSIVEEAHEAVEPTTMTMTSAEAERASKGHGVARGRCFHPFHHKQQQQQRMCGCIVDELAPCLSSISTCSSSSLVTNSSGSGRGCGECDVRRCAVASCDDDGGCG